MGIPHPGVRHGRPAKSVDGFSFRQVIGSAAAESTHPEQYAEFGGSRGYYSRGWKIVTNHRPGFAFDDSEWELYHVNTDPNELHNLAAEQPGMLEKLATRWEQAAWSNTVFPLVDRRSVSEVRRPAEAELEKPLRLLPGTPKLERYRSSRLVTMRSFTIDVDLDWTAGDQGVLVAHGDQGGGYLLYIEDGELLAAYNEYGLMHELSAGSMNPGPTRLRWDARWLPEFRWSIALEVDGHRRGAFDPVAMLIGMAPFSGIDVGVNSGDRSRGPCINGTGRSPARGNSEPSPTRRARSPRTPRPW